MKPPKTAWKWAKSLQNNPLWNGSKWTRNDVFQKILKLFRVEGLEVFRFFSVFHRKTLSYASLTLLCDEEIASGVCELALLFAFSAYKIMTKLLFCESFPLS